ncbi:HAD family hydrolase [Sulfurimonas sp.]|uniref:HAD family hydrolase n=1 Tax=Sulfurimonas sp. TaxID=2022749 RepID=UPI0025D3E399|nr:HAD family hydrolase [Sulfurimonas sp.]MDD5156929.1 HAD family hydrolase [Sulfurimonas sp.]
MKVVIFDMDGTLLDSKKDITISINHTRKINHKLPPLSEEFVVDAINMHDRNLAKLFYNSDIYLSEDKALFEEHYAVQCVQNSYLYGGVKEVLHRLVECSVKISVATNAPTEFAVRMLSHLGVYELFDIVIGSDRVKAIKPDPEMLNTILKFYGFNKNSHKAWMIGDNSKDMLSAKNAGIAPIFVTWGFSSNGVGGVTLKNPKEILEIVL